MKPPLTGEAARLALAGGDEMEVGILLALGGLLDLERLGTVAESQRPKRGPGVFLVRSVVVVVFCGGQGNVFEMGG